MHIHYFNTGAASFSTTADSDWTFVTLGQHRCRAVNTRNDNTHTHDKFNGWSPMQSQRRSTSLFFSQTNISFNTLKWILCQFHAIVWFRKVISEVIKWIFDSNFIFSFIFYISIKANEQYCGLNSITADNILHLANASNKTFANSIKIHWIAKWNYLFRPQQDFSD